MNPAMFVGPATWLFLAAQLTAGIWWASSINSTVSRLDGTTVTAERIGKLETRFESLEKTNSRLETAVNALVIELRRNP